MIDTITASFPAISVVIPVYNAQKYIGAALSSCLAQTFQNFEVIVVDDASTDESAKIIKSYIPKFGGRLKVSVLKTNSGSPATGRNKGLAMSRGKYVLFMDNDDLLVNKSLEQLYNFAENYNAELVIMDRVFHFINSTNKAFPDAEDLQIHAAQPFMLNSPTFESENPAEKMLKFAQFKIGVTPWHKFVLRDFLVENDIQFPILKNSEDIVWSLKIFFLAKRILTVPSPLYVYRINSDSITRKARPLEETLNLFLDTIVEALKILDEFFDSQEFFKENPQYRWALLNLVECIPLNLLIKSVKSVTPYQFMDILKPNFIDIFGKNGGLIAYLYAANTNGRLMNRELSERIATLENKLKQLQEI